MSKRNDPRGPSVRVGGRKVYLSDLPLIAYSLECGHVGRDRAIQAGDRVFCDGCRDTKRVAQIISA
jgi:hypothetical protein